MYGNTCKGGDAINTLSGANAAAPAAVSQTFSLLGYLITSQDETHDAISRLENALHAVLQPTPPAPTGLAADATASSPLCEELDRRLYVEHRARERIEALIQRLTV